jgi:hypothetical protein
MVGAGALVGAAEPSHGQVWPTMASYGWPYTIASVQPSMVHLFIVIPIFVYLQVKIPTKPVEPH